MSLVELFCHVDDFCQVFQPLWDQKLLSNGVRRRRRAGQLRLSEIMTLLIHFHQSHYRTFKAYYNEYVCVHLRDEFPHLVSYPRFVAVMPRALGPLCAYLDSLYSRCTGISFIDSISWLAVTDQGDLLGVHFTPGDGDDRVPVPVLAKHLAGKLFGDCGHVSQALFIQLWEHFEVQSITRLRKNMKNRLMAWLDKILLHKRAVIESIVHKLKNISQIEHTRHCSPVNFLVNVLAGLIAYCHQPQKPRIKLGSYSSWPVLIHN